MIEPKIVSEFPKCWFCGSEETISQLACQPEKDSGKISKDAFTTLRQNVVPIEQPLLATLSVKCIVTFFDVCANCGSERCTRAQIVQAPVQMQPGQGQGPGGNGGRGPGNMPPWGFGKG